MDIHTIYQEVEEYLYSKRVPVGVEAKLNGRSFCFPIQLVRHYAAYYKGALPQVYIQAVLPTMYGKVMLYGYIDYAINERYRILDKLARIVTGCLELLKRFIPNLFKLLALIVKCFSCLVE